MLARAVPRKINFPVRRSARAVSAVRNFLFKEIFKGCCLLFSYQGSCRSFQATACIGYHSAMLLSRTFFIRFRHLFLPPAILRMAFCLPPVVPPPRLRSAGFQKFSSVISDRCYLITLEGNCQRFSCFLFISDNSHIFTVSTAKNCDQHCPIIVHSVFPKTIPPFCIFFFFHTTL